MYSYDAYIYVMMASLVVLVFTTEDVEMDLSCRFVVPSRLSLMGEYRNHKYPSAFQWQTGTLVERKRRVNHHGLSQENSCHRAELCLPKQLPRTGSSSGRVGSHSEPSVEGRRTCCVAKLQLLQTEQSPSAWCEGMKNSHFGSSSVPLFLLI